MKNKVYLIDVTNRDGVQTSRILLPKLSKTMLNIYLDEMGVYQSEIGFPTLKHEVSYINGNLELVKAGAIKRIHLEGWCRAIPEDIRLTFKNCPEIKHLNISMSTSEIMIQGKFQGRKAFKDILQTAIEAVRLAKESGAETVGLNAEDASRTEINKLIEFVIAGKEAGADRFRYCDTLGCDDPITIYERIKALALATKFPIEMHCHNDLGMAEAVSVAGAQGSIESGIDAYINTTINGYGERCGNCDLVSTILALKFSHGLSRKVYLDEHVDLKNAWKIAKYASYAFNLPIPINQPGVGSNAFAHESGIHADGALKDRRNYELYDPEDVGRGEPELLETGRIITTGEYGGVKGFRHVYDKLGIHFHDDSEARNVLELVQYANLHTQKPMTDDELRFIAHYPDIARKILTLNP
ncbi:MAG: homocitrate synthase [Nitrospirae bacterium CG02_land_8_20_14_3_00_44_33]|nr:MAG: homocitrate synthase [Nitrospirae bacterium CG1_02_44_142]PIV42356.1 MAG: homocitrate synthase [Nitrospirae bacterium CG02_land_8_20_14_3_00_44_33]PIV65613.1 MAG: homocitrate synthase [Nitrospirae bacterium CG01_land_8_20_14_3_00_44_22]PJA81916.1 MAG: homocitrate synthase [Nitrospirae bacterium CG_4_9_14_3_um_filter_44_28]